MSDPFAHWLGRGRDEGTPAVDGDAVASAPRTAGGPVVIDVRTQREFETNALVGALNLPLAELAGRIRDVVADPRTPVALYCASGARSGMACMMLSQLGYSNVHNAGGLFAASAQLRLGIR